MTKEFIKETDSTVTKDKYYVTVEAVDYYEVKNEQHAMFLDKGKQATVGDYVQLFKEVYDVDAELKSISPYMEFKVPNPEPKGIRLLKVLRITKDFTYRPITKI
ncbi:hypothetical protein ACFFSY_20920 [Paenibacillus aurantiacus]|uniref:Uncharacterized protein n=1 Tax=Paenibacillus aurantiacus TaxID=1936118 RepID=A0ABV5KT68_9BACL